MRQLLKYAALFIAVCIGLLAVSTGPTLLQEEEELHPRDTEAEWEVMTELNRWRIRRGRQPLARNFDLDELAMLQARYMIDQAPFDDTVDFHTDEYGDGVANRARLFGWPTYDFNILVREIAAYYPNVAGAINFWQHSPVHSAAALEPGVRELGIAVLQNRSYILAYVVLGGRPDGLPIMYDDRRNVLFMSTDESSFADRFQPTRVRFLNSAGVQLHEDAWLVWSNRMRLPEGATDVITIIMTDGIQEYTTTINLSDVRIFPSEPTPLPTATRPPTSTPPPDLPTPTPIPPTLTPTVTPEPLRDVHDLTLYYDDEVLTLRNTSGENLDLEPLVLVSNRLGQSRTSAWVGAYAEIPLSRFPADHCMQLWSFQMSLSEPPLPAFCEVLVSGRSILDPGDRFWLAGHFSVFYRTQFIASCDSDFGMCSFDIPRTDD